jgi:hypothetical protein
VAGLLPPLPTWTSASAGNVSFTPPGAACRRQGSPCALPTRRPVLLSSISSEENGGQHSFTEEGGQNMARQLYLISDVSRMLGVPPYRIAYLFTTRKVPEPPLRLGNRRVFGLADVRRVAQALGRPLDGEGGR